MDWLLFEPSSSRVTIPYIHLYTHSSQLFIRNLALDVGHRAKPLATVERHKFYTHRSQFFIHLPYTRSIGHKEWKATFNDSFLHPNWVSTFVKMNFLHHTPNSTHKVLYAHYTILYTSSCVHNKKFLISNFS